MPYLINRAFKKMNYWDDYRSGYEENSFWLQDRVKAIQWARGKIASSNFRILDTETTGLHDRAEAVQIAIIDDRGKSMFNSLVNPIGSIDPKAEAVHGLSREKLINAPTFDKLYLRLKYLLESKPILIYNADFDSRILKQQCALNNLPPIKMKVECVMAHYSAYCGNWNEYHQSYTWVRLPNGDHSAMGDCKATLAVIKKMAHSKIL